MKFHIRYHPIAALLCNSMVIEQIIASRLPFRNLIQSNSLSYYYYQKKVRINKHLAVIRLAHLALG